MLGLIPLKDWIYLGLIVALVSFGLYERAHLIHEGEQRCLSREREAAAQQAILDAKTNEDAINALNNEISGLLSTSGPVTVSVPRRVQCYTSKVSATGGQSGAANAGGTAPEVVPKVPGGTGSGVEVGAGVQRLALSADVLAARYRACLAELKEP